MLRDLTGRTHADREKLEALQATIENTRQRIEEQQNAFTRKHEREREQAAQRHQQRQEQLSRDIYEAQRESAQDATRGDPPKLSYAQRLAARAERLRERREALEEKTERHRGQEQKKDRGRDYDM